MGTLLYCGVQADLHEGSTGRQYATFITGSEQMMVSNKELVNDLHQSKSTIFQSSRIEPQFNHWFTRKHGLNTEKTKRYNVEKGRANKE